MPSLCFDEMRFLVPVHGHGIEGYMVEDVCICFWGTCLVTEMPKLVEFTFYGGLKTDEE